MACGKAIVSTPMGCAGLHLQDGYDIAIRKDWAEFSDAVCTILSETALRTSLGARARWTAESYFSWTAIADRAYESYLTVAGQPSPARRGANRSMSVA
jgi:glycosyltransferase involved in cell wall biosynthesis